MKNTLLPVVVALLLLAEEGCCFPKGAPSSVCGSYKPSHGVGPQPPSTNPYILVADRKYYDLGEQGADNIVVNLTSTSGREKYKGFVVAAYDAEGQPFGSFESSFHGHQIPHCDQPAMTHNNAHHKTLTSLVWRPPTGASHQRGEIHFKATVVRSYKRYWLDITSTAPEDNLVHMSFI